MSILKLYPLDKHFFLMAHLKNVSCKHVFGYVIYTCVCALHLYVSNSSCTRVAFLAPSRMFSRNKYSPRGPWVCQKPCFYSKCLTSVVLTDVTLPVNL